MSEESPMTDEAHSGGVGHSKCSLSHARPLTRRRVADSAEPVTMARRRVFTGFLFAAVLILLVASALGIEEASELSVAADGHTSEAAPSEPSSVAPAPVADDETASDEASVTGKPNVQPEAGAGGEPSRESQAVEAITLELEELDRLMDVTQRQAKALQRMRQLLIDGAALPPPTGRRVLPAESLDADASSPLQR